MSNRALLLLLIALIVFGGYFFFGKQASAPTPEMTSENTSEGMPPNGTHTMSDGTIMDNSAPTNRGEGGHMMPDGTVMSNN